MSGRHAGPTRRGVLLGGAALAAASTFPFAAARAQAPGGPRHGLSVFGDLKYGPSFQHFDYVDPAAPAGGRMAFTAPSWAFNQNPQTFNTFNTFILTGDAPPRMEMCFDTLMVRALDEPDAVYGLVAETVEVSGDGNSYVFNLRPEARFHDGSPLTAEDVAFSLTMLKDKGHPAIRQTLSEMAEVQVLSPHRIGISFTGRQSRKTPLAVAGMPILSKAYYARYDFEGTTLTPPLSSGPYKVGRYEIGRFIEYQKVADWWAKDLPVSRGHFNFKTLRIEFYRNRTAGFEAFKKGATTFREEFTSKTWATEYNFPAIEDGRVIREEIPDGRPSGGQGWFLNTRRRVFADARVRQALGLVFDFEWTNKSLFFGAYQRTQSFFQNSPMFAEGEPSAEELALLEPFRDELPPEVFGPAVTAPVSDGSGNDRTMLREADRLLREAGCRRDGATLLTPDGAPFKFEILSNSPTFERVVLPYAKGLARLGIEASFRIVDPAQYQSRVNTYDFDVVSRRFPLSATLGEEIRQLWGSRSAETPGGNNLSGIRSPAVDALIDRALSAPTRERMTVVARALDRVLRAGYYWVPHWYKPVHTVAMWDLFGRPGDPPAYDFRPELHWWVDPQKAERLDMGG